MSDKIEKLAINMTETAVRVAVLEKSGWDKSKDNLDEIDKKVAVLDKQFNNGLKADVQELKEKVRVLEFSNEHNTSYRNKGEIRLQWWLDAAWKVMQIVGAAALAYYLSKK
jgi:Zn-finger domain-containing protein